MNPVHYLEWSAYFPNVHFNIESLTVAPTDDPTLSRMTIEAVGDEQVLEQIEKQLHKISGRVLKSSI